MRSIPEAPAAQLTTRQREILAFVNDHSAQHGYPPTVREIGKAVGLHSSSTVHAHLANLEKIGLLRRATALNRAAIERTVQSWSKGMRWRELNRAYHAAVVDLGGFVRDPGAMVATLKDTVVQTLDELTAIPTEQRLEQRYARLRALGNGIEPLDPV